MKISHIEHRWQIPILRDSKPLDSQPHGRSVRAYLILSMPAAAYLFDIGKVIIHFDFGRTVAAVADRCSAGPPSALLEMVTDLTIQLELGELTPDDFVSSACQRVGFTGDPAEFRAAFEDVFELNQPMVEFIEKQYAAGIPLYLLSNTNGIHVPFFTWRYPVFSLFSAAIYSHEVGCMKPDRKIYEIAIERLSLSPGETVYIDDMAENCAAGRESGLQAICYDRENHAAFLESVAALL